MSLTNRNSEYSTESSSRASIRRKQIVGSILNAIPGLRNYYLNYGNMRQQMQTVLSKYAMNHKDSIEVQ